MLIVFDICAYAVMSAGLQNNIINFAAIFER